MPGRGKARDLFTFKNIYRAYIDCRRNKRSTCHAAKFELHLEQEILKLARELQNHTYKPERSICFVVTEPSLREVFAGTFRDRVIHHLLYNLLSPIFEPIFAYGSYACRKDKGIHQSLHDLQRYLKKVTRNQTRQAYFLHLDIRAFFMSLKKGILFELIRKQVKNPEILKLAKIIIFNDPIKNYVSKSSRELFAKIPPHKSLFHVPSNQGLPIGNLTSQFFANVYMNKLDQFAKHSLKAKYYLRYVDDFLMLSDEKEQLLEWRDRISIFLKEQLELDLNSHKQILQTTDKGIDWLGYIVKSDCVLVRRRIVSSFKQKLFLFNQKLQEFNNSTPNSQLVLPFATTLPPIETIEHMLATINSYFGHFSHADTFTLRKHLWESHFQDLRKYVEPTDDRLTAMTILPELKKAKERERAVR